MRVSPLLPSLIPRFVLLALVHALSSSPGASAQTANPPPGPHQVKLSPPLTQEQFLAYWTTETGWMSELQLRNNAPDQSLTVVPALRLPNGEEVSLGPVVIQPQEVKAVDIDAAAIAAGAPQFTGTYGSAVLRYTGPAARVLYAAVMIRRVGHPIAFHVDATGEDLSWQAGSREGIWWMPNETANDYLIVNNQGANVLPVNLSLYDPSGKETRQPMALQPRETRRFSVRQMLHAAGLAGSFGGIRIAVDSHSGSLNTLHFLFDESAGFSAILKMFDHQPNTTLGERDYARTNTWTLRAPMLALQQPDPELKFPQGTILQPQVLLRNITAKPADIGLRFRWRGASATGTSAGPSLRLQPLETRRIDIASLQNGETLPADANWTSVTLTTTTQPDEVLAVAASYDSSLRYGAQTPFSDQLTYKWEGGMWEYDGYHNSIVTAGNGGTKPTQAAFSIFYHQGSERFDLEQPLQPDEQMWIDIGKLIREQVPDKNGRVLPKDLTSGSYEFRDLTHRGTGTLFEGKVVYDKMYGHAAYGCAGCCGYDYLNAALIYNPLGIPFDSTAPQGVTAPDMCQGGALADVSDSFTGSWNTASSSIATVNTYGTHTGVAVGSTTSQTQGYLNSNASRACPLRHVNPIGNDNVTPTFAGVLTPSDNFGGRSTSRFGLGETISLSFNANPPGTTAASFGGLQWSIVSGGGTLTGVTTNGTATYTAPIASATAVLRLAVASGSSQGQGPSYTITVVSPSAAHLTLASNLRHTQGFISIGFEGKVFLLPTDVSFANLQFAEGTVQAVASGYFAPLNGAAHAATASPFTIGFCDSVIGCQVNALDTVDTQDDSPPFSAGDFLWAIPWQYKAVGGVLTNFTTANQHFTADATGKATAEKAGAGPYSKNASDPTTYY